jgi:hypothetical protein
MHVRRLTLIPLVLAGLIALVAALDARRAERAVARDEGAAPLRAYCDGITGEDLDRLIEATKVEEAALAKESAAAKKQKDAADAKLQQGAAGMVADMMKTGECTDAFKAKDPRSKEIDRLYELASNASARGSDQQADKYNQQAGKIEEALDIAADRACGGKGASFIADCRESAMANDPRTAERDALRKKADEAHKNGKQAAGEEYRGKADQLSAQIEAEAAMTCVTKMTQAQLGQTLISDQAASQEASQRMHNASNVAAKEAVEAAGMSEDELGRLRECIVGRIRRPEATPMNAQSSSAIDARRAELQKVLGL